MKKLFLILGITLLATNLSADNTPYQNFCKENPFAKRCVSPALGGTNSLEKERKRERRDEYRDSPYTGHDIRTRPGQDLDDPRESL